MEASEGRFPKVLIIGTPFNKTVGGGITMTNLFLGWPKDRLALASNANLQYDLDTSVCELHYQLGYKNKLHPFPINIFLPRIHVGQISKTNHEGGFRESQRAKPGKYKSLYRFLSIFLHFFGIYNFIYKLKITPEFNKWIIDFNPDIIYSQLSTLELIRFVNEIEILTGKPLVIHMMDDWPLTINKSGILSFYWGKRIDKDFRQLLSKASVLMSICDSMSEEYKFRYGRDFLPFHNPIDTNFWLPFSKSDYTVKDKFTVFYAGRIGIGIKNSIKDIVAAVNMIFIEKPDIQLEIQTSDIEELEKIIEFNDHIKWVKPTDYSELPRKFSSVDVLVLPNDFDSKSIDFLRYSFSTKISEFMISGTPILLYADPQIAMTKYAIKENWAYVVTENSTEMLIKAISDLYLDLSLRKKLGERAKKIALAKEDSSIVREQFRKCFIRDKKVNIL